MDQVVSHVTHRYHALVVSHVTHTYGVATIIRLLNIIDLFGKKAQ